MGKRQAPRHHDNKAKVVTRKFVNNPSLKWMEEGQVLFANVAWDDENGHGEKRRPVVFVEKIDHNRALVQPIYSKSTQNHQQQIVYNRSRRYIGPPIEVHRSDITAVTNERIKWD